MPKLFVCVLLLLATGCSQDPTLPAHPNIIVILADDLGYGDVSAFHPGNKIKTPNIDRIANEGMRFTDAHTSSAVCTPTRYGLLTGRYNWRTRLKQGVLTGKSKALIPNQQSTLASVLRQSGYHTAFIGKWHLGWDWAWEAGRENAGSGWQYADFDGLDFSRPVTNSPNDLGFAYGHSGSLDMAPYVYVENGLPTARPDTFTVDTGKYTWWRKGPTAPDFVHDDVTPNFFRRGMAYVTERAATGEPFFLYLPLPSPHTPILPTEEWAGKSGLNPYADFVLMIDHYVGRLLATLEEANVADNTLIVFTSDNGCSPAAKIEELIAGGHHPSSIYRGHKADIYEGGHRVPCAVRWPARIAPGGVSSEIICLTDLLATCAAITDYELGEDEGVDSYNLLPLLEGNPVSTPLREGTIHHSINGSFAIRKDAWKLILCPGSGGWSFPRPGRDEAVLDTLPPWQLYNLEEDPAETNNLYATNPQKVTELKNLLTKYVREGRSTPGRPQTNDPISVPWPQTDFLKK
ncbi:MAG: arylsulfatase [Bacteroidota bacterium]